MVYRVTHYLEVRKVITPYYRFYVSLKKLNKLYGLYFMKTYILNKKLEHCITLIVSDTKNHKVKLNKTIK